MLRIRTLAALCSREFSQSKSLGRWGGRRRGGASIVIRTLTDDHGVGSAAATAAAAAAPFDGAHVANRQQEAGGWENEESLAVDEIKHGRQGFIRARGQPWDSQRWTPEAELVSKLKKMRTNKGPGHARLAIKLLQEARSNGTTAIVAYNVVIRMLGVEKWMVKDKMDTMEELVCQLKEDGLEPNVYTYNGIMYLYAQARSAGKAERAYQEMIDNGVEPNVITLSSVIMAQCWGSRKEMYRTLAEMDVKGWIPTRGAHLCLIAAMWQAKDTSGVVKMMRRMLEQDYRLTEAAFAVSLMAAGRLGDADFAKILFDKRIEAGLGPREEVYASMMLAHAKANHHDECLGYWRQLVCVDGIGDVAIKPETMQCALKSAVVAGQWQELEGILDMMQARGIRLNEQTFKTAIAGCRAGKSVSGVEHWERVERVVQVISGRGIEPSKQVLVRMGVACTHAKRWDKAVSLFQDAMARNGDMWPFAWECLIRALLAQERFGAVKEMWTRNKSEAEGPTHRANELAISASQRLLDADWALELLAIANAQNKSSSTMHAITISVLAETGRLAEARDLLQTWRADGAIRLNHRTMNTLLLFCERHGNTEIALDFFKEMRAQTPPHRLQPATLAVVIAALCKHGRAGEVVALFEQLLAETFKPEADCYVHVAHAAFEARDREGTIRYCDEAKKRDRTPSEATCAFADGGVAIGTGVDEDDSRVLPTAAGGDANGVSTARGQEGGAPSPPLEAADDVQASARDSTTAEEETELGAGVRL